MRHARAYALAGIAVLAVGAVAFAQTTVTPLEEPAPVEALPLEAVSAVADLATAQPGDIQRGATLAGTCAACHGLDGKSVVPDMYPNLAGQAERYTAHQLALFKSSERLSPIMQPFAMMLSAQDMRDVGAYYATQAPGAGIADDTEIAEGPYAGMKFYEVGQTIYRSGDAARGIPACMACHGPSGAGNPGPAYPHVGGQQAWYTEGRLKIYRDGTTSARAPGQFEIMAAIAKDLTDEEIGALASYMQGLHRRPDPAMLAAIAAAPAPSAPPAEAPAAAPADAGDAGDATGVDAAEGEAAAGDAAPAEADGPAQDA